MGRLPKRRDSREAGKHETSTPSPQESASNWKINN